MSKSNVAVAGKKGVVLIPLGDIKSAFYVRRELDEGRVEMFRELYESSAEVPPIEVIQGSMELFEGRHRLAALQRMERPHAECKLIPDMPADEKFAEAFGRNFGGALPPTRADGVFVIRQMLEAKTPNNRIKNLFVPRFFRPSHFDKILKDAYSQIAEAKMNKALQAVASGDVTAKAAAKTHGVDLDDLKAKLGGRKAKPSSTSIAKMKAQISNNHRSVSQRTIALFRELFDCFEDSEITEKKVLEVISHAERLNKDALKRLRGWRERFAALKRPSKGAESKKVTPKKK